ncbi:hypothetical protein R1flu_010800 [Riccia fluitans]|uniref:Uncharacterized protein n=1 Tax=Riccia fluitans TaxID=41844 RepID=A0ABD1Z602_9MARC
MWTLYPKRRRRRRRRRRKWDLNNHLGSVQDLSPTPRMATKEISLQPSFLIFHRSEAPMAVDEVVLETLRKGKEKVTESLHLPNVDIAAEDRRRLKIRLNTNRLEMDPPLSTPQVEKKM